MGLGAEISARVERALSDIESELRARMSGAPEALTRAAREVLDGARSGRRYRTSAGSYRASAPGEPPARRTGEYARSWSARDMGARSIERGVRMAIRLESSLPERARRLERGAGNVAPRPHIERIRASCEGELAKLIRGGD